MTSRETAFQNLVFSWASSLLIIDIGHHICIVWCSKLFVTVFINRLCMGIHFGRSFGEVFELDLSLGGGSRHTSRWWMWLVRLGVSWCPPSYGMPDGCVCVGMQTDRGNMRKHPKAMV